MAGLFWITFADVLLSIKWVLCRLYQKLQMAKDVYIIMHRSVQAEDKYYVCFMYQELTVDRLT